MRGSDQGSHFNAGVLWAGRSFRINLLSDHIISRRKIVLLDEYLFERNKGIQFIKYQHCLTVFPHIYATIREWRTAMR